MKKTKKITETKNVETEELPIASLVINEYQMVAKQLTKANEHLTDANKHLTETNENLQKSNKRVTILALILLILFAIETTYIILYWEAMHPDSGVIQDKSSK